jgi:hypothetical protein|tara:strand:- start:288 stop:578 length:291 start_codon:yes stop_codon:yes gene_type:complete
MNYKIIILIFVFILTLFIPYLTTKEGFQSYPACIEEGYPMDFCMKTPVESTSGSNFCSCGSGFFGSFHMDDGKCYCYLFDGLLPQNTSKPFETSPF